MIKYISKHKIDGKVKKLTEKINGLKFLIRTIIKMLADKYFLGAFIMKNQKLNIERLEKIAKMSDVQLNVYSTWTIPVTEFTFTAATAGYTWYKSKSGSKRK